ncbi:hypothetical protein ED733_008562 [Metarhizium rileyi]|uniref:Uncharacterized protein n=1 Tax=Metarhizium rileyi (strain RCEF 4871) TaxID=1649241 RepID=A0A5C6GMR3_METRR|nr:hypothetical protein ED733_008562 [Metarhizium rileyi]
MPEYLETKSNGFRPLKHHIRHSLSHAYVKLSVKQQPKAQNAVPSQIVTNNLATTQRSHLDDGSARTTAPKKPSSPAIEAAPTSETRSEPVTPTSALGREPFRTKHKTTRVLQRWQ